MKILKFRALNILIVALIGAFCCTSYDHDKPDTLDNKKGFERHFGLAVPESVSDLYYFADEWIVDEKYQLGFKADQETIEKIVSNLNLKQIESNVNVGLASEFPWWDKEDIQHLTPYWKTNQTENYYWYLWYNSETQKAYYIEFSQ